MPHAAEPHQGLADLTQQKALHVLPVLAAIAKGSGINGTQGVEQVARGVSLWREGSLV